MASRYAKNRKARVILSSLATMLIIGGIFLALFPFLQAFYYENIQKPPEQQQTIDNPPAPVESDTPPPVEEIPSETLLEEPGLLEIPKLGLSLEVGYGVTKEDLKKGPGFYPQSGYPDTGNVSIAGHRNCYGSPFWHLDKMEKDDDIILTYHNKVYYYKVESVFVTHSRDWSVVDPTPEPALTLTTCTPLQPVNGHYDRLIVRAYLQSTATASS